MGMTDGWRLEPGGQVRGTLTLPGDKSISHRALLIAALAEGSSRLDGVLDSEDCRATAQALAQLGMEIRETSPGSWLVEGRGPDGLQAPEAPLDLGNSGTAMRLLCGLLAARRVAPRLSRPAGAAAGRRPPAPPLPCHADRRRLAVAAAHGTGRGPPEGDGRTDRD